MYATSAFQAFRFAKLIFWLKTIQIPNNSISLYEIGSLLHMNSNYTHHNDSCVSKTLVVVNKLGYITQQSLRRRKYDCVRVGHLTVLSNLRSVYTS